MALVQAIRTARRRAALAWPYVRRSTLDAEVRATWARGELERLQAIADQRALAAERVAEAVEMGHAERDALADAVEAEHAIADARVAAAVEMGQTENRALQARVLDLENEAATLRGQVLALEHERPALARASGEPQ